MRKIIFLILLFLPLLAFNQEAIIKVDKMSNDWKIEDAIFQKLMREPLKVLHQMDMVDIQSIPYQIGANINPLTKAAPTLLMQMHLDSIIFIPKTENVNSINRPGVTMKSNTTYQCRVQYHFELYSIETGELVDDFIIKANSSKYRTYASATAADRSKKIFAAEYTAAKAGTRAMLRIRKNIFPALRITGLELEKKGKAQLVRINVGDNYDVIKMDYFEVYTEKEYNVGGTTKIRTQKLSTLSVKEVGPTESICKVRKGNEEILKLIKEGATIKCRFTNNYNMLY